jgi:hypothetical protein
MALLNKLQTQGSVLSNLNGETATIPNFAGSKLHDTYSINNDPNVPGKPSPSQLDLNGEKPANNYRDNAPEGASF